MKGKLNLILLIGIISFTNCETNESKREVTVTDTVSLAKKETLSVYNISNDETKKAVNFFFDWYKQKYDTISSIVLVTIPDDGKSLYSVNFDNSKVYINVLNSSGLFTNNFLRQKEIYFNSCNLRMKREKQTDGPPIGFEHDLLLLSQEPDFALEKIEEAKFINTQKTNNKYIVDTRILNDLRFYLILDGTKYLIDSISIR